MFCFVTAWLKNNIKTLILSALAVSASEKFLLEVSEHVLTE
jgi:hypothetical protein